MDLIFQLVANSLFRVSQILGLTYNEINIILYYLIIPFTWLVLLDKIFKFHYLKITFRRVPKIIGQCYGNRREVHTFVFQ